MNKIQTDKILTRSLNVDYSVNYNSYRLQIRYCVGGHKYTVKKPF